MFDELQEHIREQVMGVVLPADGRGHAHVSPEDIARFKDMLAELNGLIEMRERGEDTQPAFDGFMSRHGDLFPDEPRDARRAARAHGPAHGGDERADGLALTRAAGGARTRSPSR